MSAYVTCKTQFKDRDSLVQALRDLGFVVEVNEQAVELSGYGHVSQPVQIVVRKAAQSCCLLSDAGFSRQADGSYALVASDWDTDEHQQNFGALGQPRQNQIKARYAYHQTVKVARAKGYSVASEKSSDGKTKLVLRRYA